MENKIVTFESRFDKPEKFNSSFHKVKIYVAYAGKNRNRSIISKETFEKIIPSIYGIPIIGDYHDDSFHGHGGEIVINDDGINYHDTTRAFGYIDSSAKVDWELVTEEDGTEREYLTVDGFLWTEKYPESLETLDGNHNQSMELTILDGAMSSEDENYFEILDAEFLALCILSSDTEPCFESAKISQFNLDKDAFKSEFAQMVAELKTSMNFVNTDKNTIEGGDNVEDKKFEEEEIVETTEETKEEVVEETTKQEQEFKSTEEEATDDTSQEVKEEEIEEENFELKYNELLEKFNELEANYKTLKTENEELKEFKAQKDKEEFEAEQEKIKQEKIDHINTEYANISNDIKELFISKVDEYESTEDIDADICVYIVKNKVTFSKANNDKSTSIKVDVDEKEQNPVASPYGDLF